MDNSQSIIPMQNYEAPEDQVKQQMTLGDVTVTVLDPEILTPDGQINEEYLLQYITEDALNNLKKDGVFIPRMLAAELDMLGLVKLPESIQGQLE
jgi:hypothetical protein